MQSEPQSITVAQAIQIGLKHHQAGRLAEAEQLYQQVLGIDPNNPEALQLLGVIAHQGGNNELAAELIGKSLTIRPDHAQALRNQGLVLQELTCYEEALASYDRALSIKPDFAEALNGRGNVLQELERYEEALASYDMALTVKPSHAAALCNRGNALQKLAHYADALASYDQALTIEPDFAEALSERGNALQELKRYEEALASYERALTIKPSYVMALSNRGTALQMLKRHEEALASYDQALTIKPDHVEALSNRGFTLQVLKRYEEALASYDKVLTIKPDHAKVLGDRGNALQELKRYEEALASFDKALTIEPDFAAIHWNESLCRLLVGDFERGWKQYEWRWKWDSFPSSRRDFLQPLWLGQEEIAGKAILLHAEQGLGDTIQFARYTQFVAQQGARVVLEVQPPLRSLLSDIAGAHKVLSHGDPLPEFDFHCPMLSLPLAFNTRLDTIPAKVPYLKAGAATVKKWKEKLGRSDTPTVGIVWSGSPTHTNDRYRSIALSRLTALANSGATIVSLQNDVRAGDEGILAANKQILHFGPELKDFSDTAALVSLMDLVISVDTSVAHLAGALGKPVWILLPFSPDWRWLVDRDDSPWYPTARLFRQSRVGDWDGVLDKVQQQLHAFLRKSFNRATELPAK